MTGDELADLFLVLCAGASLASGIIILGAVLLQIRRALDRGLAARNGRDEGADCETLRFEVATGWDRLR